MTKKRKISYEQSLALDRGRSIARANQRRRTAQRQADDRAIALARQAECDHVHGWKNWDYVLNYTHEVRQCRECGYAEIRQVRL